MRLSFAATWLSAVSSVLVACSSSTSDAPASTPASGGTTGGGASAGGTSAGKSAAGASAGSAGKGGSGGSTNQAGSAGKAGAPGGAAAGGTAGTGGKAGAGGKPATGGNAGSSGTSGTAGASGKGGSGGTSGVGGGGKAGANAGGSAGASGGAGAGGATGGATAAPKRLGVYTAGFEEPTVAAFESWLGRPVDYAVTFLGDVSWSDFKGSAGWGVGQWWGMNPKRKILWSVPLLPKDGTATLADAASGAYDAEYADAAASIASHYPDAVIRVGWEFNGDWYAWSAKGKTDAYKGAFARLVGVFRKASPAFVFDWCPNLGPNQFPAEDAYPGDSVVDVIGMDVYDFNWNMESDPVVRWNQVLTGNHALTWHRDFAKAHQKPMSYPEWAQGQGSGDDPYFIEQMHAWFEANDVVYQSYWDSDAGYTGKLDGPAWPLAAAKYKALFATY